MLKAIATLVLVLLSLHARALSPEAREFMKITKALEPVQCEKRKLRREIALAEVEGQGERVRQLRARFAELDRDPQTARLEKRLAELERRMPLGSEDLDAISFQQRQAMHRCE
jgi:hypothetical protein